MEYLGKENTEQLDKKSKLPLYYQLSERLRELILSGIYPEGSRFLTEQEIMNRFGVSRSSVRQAVENLQQEGLLVCIQGKGSYVTQPKIKIELFKKIGLSQILESKGYRLITKVNVLEIQGPNDDVAEVLRMAAGEKIYFLERIRLINDIPSILEKIYLPTSLYPGLCNNDLVQRHLYQALAKYGFEADHYKQSLEPVPLNIEEARALETKKAATGLLLRRITFDTQNKPIEYVKAIHRVDRFTFQIDLG